MRRYGEYGLALLLDLVGAAGALLVSLRTWQVITTPRAGRHDDVLHLSGRTVDAAPTALALVALAGVVAVLATRGVLRRVVGVVLAVAGAGLVWRALADGPVSAERARSLVRSHHKTVTIDAGTVPHIVTHAVWPVLTLVCGVLVGAAGVLVAWRGHRWRAMGARYESGAPAKSVDSEVDSEVDPEQERGRAATRLWTALDRGEDPTDR